MLASNECLLPEELKDLRYPKLVSHKLDGIRCRTGLVNNGTYTAGTIVGYSRSLKVLPNIQVQQGLSNTGVGFDGEIIISGATFHEIQSKVMSEYTLPFSWEFWVFDCIPTKEGDTYLQRLQKLRNRFNLYGLDNMHVLEQVLVHSPESLLRVFKRSIKMGYEGLIIRDPDAPWKEGRSTRKEEWMLKMKQFVDAEAIVIGFEEEKKNNNPKTKSELGYSKRSSHKANKQGKGTLGALIVRDCASKEIFNVGSGFDAKLRQEIWNNQVDWLGQTVTYKSHVYGVKDKPRSPVFKGCRYD